MKSKTFLEQSENEIHNENIKMQIDFPPRRQINMIWAVEKVGLMYFSKEICMFVKYPTNLFNSFNKS